MIETTNLIDWSPVAEPLGQPVSRARARLLHRNPDGSGETGTWECGPGERLEIGPSDAAFFPAGWSGVCEVLEVVRTTYMIR